MAKLSTLTALLLWLTISVGSSWAGKVESWTEWSTKGLLRVAEKPGDNEGESLSEVPTKSWINLLRGAVACLEANKYESALTIVAGVNARGNEMKWGNVDDRKKFKQAGDLIEEALAEDKKDKAIVLINALTATMRKSGLTVQPDVAGGVRTKSRELLEEDEKRKRMKLEESVRQAFKQIEKNELKKAEDSLQEVYQILREVPQKETKTDKFLSFIAALDQTEKYIKQGDKQKAAAVLKEAAPMLKLGEPEDDVEKEKMKVQESLKQAFRHIEKNELKKAEDIMHDVYLILKDVTKKDTKSEYFAKFMAALDHTEKYIKQGNKQKAAAALKEAAAVIKMPLGEPEESSTGSKYDHKAGEDHDTNQQIKKEMLEKFLRQAITAIKGEERAKAEKMLKATYQILKNDKNMATEEKAVKFLEAIEETMKYIKADAKDKAEQALHDAAVNFGIQPPQGQDQPVRNRKTGASDSEL